MKLPLFKLEDYLGNWEFKAPHLLCPSDAEKWSLAEILSLATPEDLDLWNHLSLGYTEVRGSPALREEISRLYKHISPEDLLVFAGAEEGIYCLFQSLLKPGDHVIVPTPCYQSLLDLPRALGASATEIPLRPEKNWDLDLNLLEHAIQPNTKMLILNYPHNPSGAILSKAKFTQVIELARKHNLYLFCDEVYRLMELDPQNRLPTAADAYEKGISLGVMSKAFGLAGLRIGWLASRDRTLLRQAELHKHYTSICNSAPSEHLSLIALKAKDTILKRNREIQLQNYELLLSFFNRHKDLFHLVPPQGGTICYPQYLGGDGVAFVEKMREKFGILLMPDTLFDGPPHHVRFGFGKQSFPQALSYFETKL